MERPIIDFKFLEKQKDLIIKQLYDDGYIVVKNIPNHPEYWQEFQTEIYKFAQLPDNVKKMCTPENFFSHGWELGKEKFLGKVDTFKGSYYADLPNSDQNVWPKTLPKFKEAYLRMGQLIFDTGLQIQKLVGITPDLHSSESKEDGAGASLFDCKCRMLHYMPITHDDGNPNWCGKHRDHGIFTGLCPAVYFMGDVSPVRAGSNGGNLGGTPIEKPKDGGLYIRGVPITIPKDCMAFQVGEVAQMLTDGKIQATDHWVKKPLSMPKGLHRITFVAFIDSPPDYKIYSKDKYYTLDERYYPGITYEEWGMASYKKYFA